MDIPRSIAEIVQNKWLTFKTLPGAGHFLMLEQPDLWTKNILEFTQTPKSVHAVVIDSGSTGSRVLAFSFRHHPVSSELILYDELWEQSKPGLSSYAGDPAEGAASITSLLELAKARIPQAAWASTPVFVAATAGLRLLPADQSEALIDAIKKTLHTSVFIDRGVDILSELDEGVFGWVTVNYLLHKLTTAAESYVALDLGGGSTQVTFLPKQPATLASSPASFLHKVKVGGVEETLYSHSYLGAGLMAAREAVFRLHDPEDALELASACLVGEHGAPQGFKKYKVKAAQKVGYTECMEEVKLFVASVEIDQCEELPTRGLVAFSYFYDRAVDAGLLRKGENGVVQVADYLTAAEVACSQPDPSSPFLCADLTIIGGLLHHGYSLALDTPLELYKKIDGHETSWALGAAFNLLE